MALSILRLDMRTPAFSPAKPGDLYRAAIDMARWADEVGFTFITLSEHHGVADGYLSSPLVMAGLIAGATERIPINISALLAPLHDPVRLAEDLAVLDVVSKGRVITTVGLGYRPVEYQALGADWKRRGVVLDECIETMLTAWKAEPFEYRGVEYRVMPPPHTAPHPPLVVGGSTKAAARRAARFSLPFAPAVHDMALKDCYDEECARLGSAAKPVFLPGEAASFFVSEDPDRTWSQIEPHVLHEVESYRGWQPDGQRSAVLSTATDIDEVKAEGKFRVLTPQECIDYAKSQGPWAAIIHMPLVGGLPPEVGWESLRLYAEKVMPHL